LRRLASNQAIEAPCSDRTLLRVYADSRPRNLLTAPLRKGLILVWKGRETIMEGMGFGAPVACYHDRHFFSSSGQTLVAEKDAGLSVSRSYVMDCFLAGKVAGLHADNPLYGLCRTRLERAYRRGGLLRQVMVAAMKVYEQAGVRRAFVKTAPRGVVWASYVIGEGSVEVEVSFEGLSKQRPLRINILNEQGPSESQSALCPWLKEAMTASSLGVVDRAASSYGLSQGEEGEERTV